MPPLASETEAKVRHLCDERRELQNQFLALKILISLSWLETANVSLSVWESGGAYDPWFGACLRIRCLPGSMTTNEPCNSCSSYRVKIRSSSACRAFWVEGKMRR